MGFTVKEFQENIAIVENNNMGPPNPESSNRGEKLNKRLAQNDTGGAESKKQRTADKRE